MMFCTKCGANVPDNVNFCSVCGQPMSVAEVPAQPVAPVAPVAEVPAQPVAPVAPVAEVPAQPVAPVAPVAEVPAQPVAPVAPVAEVPAQPVYAPATPVAAPQKNNKTLWMAIIAAVAVVAVILACVLLFGGNTFQSILDDNLDVIMEGDVSDLEDLAPPCAWAKLLDKKGVSISQLTSGERYEAAAESLATQYGMVASMGDVEYNVVNDTQADEGVKIMIAKELQDAYGEYGLQYSMVGDVQILQVEITAEALGQTNTETEQMYAVEIDGDWYLLSDEDEFAAYETAVQIYNLGKSSSGNALNDYLEDYLD